MLPPYPWQSKQWETIAARHRAQKFPHALLLTGEAGLGKKAFAAQVAKLLLCEAQAPCHTCPACQLLENQNHPDLITVALRDKEKSIGVETIRDILPQCYETPQRGKSKVVMILAAELLNNAACNALLKTLEEPEANTYFILVCDSLYHLPQTLRSRCQMLRFYAQDFTAREWLKTQTDVVTGVEAALYLTQGAPLEALDWLQHNRLESYQQIWIDAMGLLVEKKEPLSIAEKWQTQPLETVLNALHWLWIIALQNAPSTPVIDSDMARLHRCATALRQHKSRYQLGLDCDILLGFRKLVYQNTPFNLNMQLAALCVRLC